MFYEKEGMVEHLTFHMLCILYIYIESSVASLISDRETSDISFIRNLDSHIVRIQSRVIVS